MDEFEKVEKLRQRADVSYEEARDALRACDGDILDAMVYLEKLGHAKAPEQATFSTNAETKENYENVPEVIVESQKNNDPSFGERLMDLIKTGIRKGMENYLVISNQDKELIRMPLLIVIILFFFAHMGILIAIIISLFFGVRYSIVGKDDLSAVNELMDKAGDRASKWMDENVKKNGEPGKNENVNKNGEPGKDEKDNGKHE